MSAREAPPERTGGCSGVRSHDSEGAEEGKDYGEEGKNHTSNLTIKVERASSPDVSEAVVEFTRNPGFRPDRRRRRPAERPLRLLRDVLAQGGRRTVYRCASAAKCPVGATDGSLTTPREPEAAEDPTQPEESAGASKIAAADDDATLTLEDVYTISAAAVPSSDGGS